MAHNLATTNGRTAMAFYGQKPWHGLGTELDHPATAAEAMVAAGLDYGVDLTPLFTKNGDLVPQRQGVVRTDTNRLLGTVGPGYRPIQNADCFGFLDTVVGDGGLRYHTAGALGQGEKIWMLAKLPGHIQVKDTEDVTDKFLLLHNSHDGTSCLRVHFTPIRVVCQNTLAIAERNARGHGVAIRHRGDLSARVQEAQYVLGLATQFYDAIQLKINRLASYYPTSHQLGEYFRALYPDPIAGNATHAQNVRAEWFRLFEDGIGQDIPGIRHTAWAALHAVTEYVDHKRPTRGRSELDRLSRRLESQWFGTGARLKQRAWNLALEMAT